jgi:hypothetical protein
MRDHHPPIHPSKHPKRNAKHPSEIEAFKSSRTCREILDNQE